MDKKLDQELRQVLEDLRNTAVPMTDAQVRLMIDELRALIARIVRWRTESGSRP